MNFSQQNPSFSSKIGIDSLDLAKILCYPQVSDLEYISRLHEIHSLGVNAILSTGTMKIGKISIAGKGCVSLVVKAEVNNKICALKIRRTDANRITMKREVAFHRIANSAKVGPILIDHSDNLIAMDFIDGWSIIDWVRQPGITRHNVRNVVSRTLEQCYNLDRAHIDHGQLSCLDHHVIISKSGTPIIIDFESSSTQRKTSNVTAAAQSLFLSGVVSKRVNWALHLPKREEIIQMLRIYKRGQTRDNLERIMQLFL
jgi:putative serine/threonine protein kinase